MLYSIIPPIIVVTSLIGIILFLARKASQVALLNDRKKEETFLKKGMEKKSLLGRIFRSKGGEERNFKHGFLVFLEKFTRKLRVFFLKLENLFTHWSEALKRKRKNQIDPEMEKYIYQDGTRQTDDGICEKTGEENNIQSVRAYETKDRIYFDNPTRAEHKPSPENVIEKIVKPILSAEVAVPKSKPEIKNRLERILIERIASNPKDTEAYERLGEYYFEIENYEHSKECFKQVIKLNPMNVSVKDKMRQLERLLARR
jgi:tetratricopeptide (TPR) repeat protein